MKTLTTYKDTMLKILMMWKEFEMSNILLFENEIFEFEKQNHKIFGT